jgi:uncharacterized phage protein gp47/JayE
VHERLIADRQARLPDHDVSKWSDNWKRLRTIAFGIWGLYHAGKLTYDDLFPDTASEDGLTHWGRMLDVERRGATVSRKSDALRVVGTNGSTANIGEELVHANGKTYALNENVTIPATPPYFDADVVSVDTGSATHLEAGEILEFSSPPAGIETEAELQLDLDEDGEDQESIGAWRTRILDKLGEPGLGGNANDYRTWMLEVTGIATAYVYPLRAGRGSVDCAALHTGSGTVRALSSLERIALLAAIDEEKPVHVRSTRVLETTTTAVNVDIEITPRPGSAYASDWTDQTLLVGGWTAGTRTLQFDRDRPADMLAGDRIIIYTITGDGDGKQYVIEELGAGTDDVILEEAPNTAPDAGDIIYSGGPIIEDIRDAILEYIDGLGPAVGDYGTGEWDSDINPQRLEAEALTRDGVQNALCNLPATTTAADDPVYPNDDEIEYLIPQQTVIRYA